MKSKSFSAVIEVSKRPEEVSNSIIDLKGWWSESIKGQTDLLNEVFLYNYKDIHICKLQLTEYIVGKKIVYKVLENHFNFTKDKSEWKGTFLCFNITTKNKKTNITFTHEGLTPAYECYLICEDAWTNYITESLFNFITKGKGSPNPKEGGFNAEIVKKWNIGQSEEKADYTFSFNTVKDHNEVFKTLLNPKKWWIGLYSEKISGASEKIGDKFTFTAGDGAHYSKQELIELIPGRKIVWLVTESKLTFLNKENEWNNTMICFDISREEKFTRITFTHIGLVPEVECYNGCSGAWGMYLKKLKSVM